MLGQNRPLICWWCKGELKQQALTSPWLSLSWWDCSENHSDAERGGRRNNVSVSKREAVCHAISPFPEQATAKALPFLPHPLSLAEQLKDTAPWTLVWWCFLKNASSFRQFSMTREAEGKGEFPISWSLNTFQLALKSAHQTLGHVQETPPFRRLQRRALLVAAG